MTKVSTIISFPVLSLYEGELIGQVNKIYFDKKLKKLTHVMIGCEGDLNYILSSKDIYKLGKNAITIKNNSCLILDIDSDLTDYVSNPIESKAYTIQGEYLGKIVEISINEKFNVSDITLDNEKLLDCKKLASCGKNTVIVYDENTKINVSRFKNSFAPNLFKRNDERTVNTQPVPPTMEEPVTEITLPKQASNNPKFMIGRIATQDIWLDDKKLLIKQSSTITEKTLSLACSHNKIKDLMMYSKQK